MFLKQGAILLFVITMLFLGGCNEYQKVLKSDDLEYKLQKGIEYYESKKYAKALPIFDELLTLYRGTAKAQDVYYYYAMTLVQTGDYLVAAYHFKTFYQTFPNNAYADEAAFMVGFCYYKESPAFSLDQTNTFKAINEIQLYINTHPYNQHFEECNMMMDEMRAKLEKKSFLIAKQYWRTEKYKAAVEALNSSMNDYPDTPFREEAMYLKLDSSYKLATNSIVSLQKQRYKEAQTAYYDLITLYPETEYKKQADEINDKIVKEIEVLDETLTTINNNS